MGWQCQEAWVACGSPRCRPAACTPTRRSTVYRLTAKSHIFKYWRQRHVCKSMSTWKNSLSRTHTHTHIYTRQAQSLIPTQIRHTSNFTSPLTRAKIQVHTPQNHQCTFIPKITQRSIHVSSWKPCVCHLTYSPQSPCGPGRPLIFFPIQRWGSRDSKVINGSLSKVRTCE